MTCPRCRASVSDESRFCLRCGAPLLAGPAPAAGVREEPPPARAGPPAPGPPAAPVAPGGRQAYALSFRPVADERQRYRVARWVVERAPAHTMGEVQDGLARGTFVTFLALTPEEIDATEEAIRALGLTPGIARLAPAGAADLLLPGRAETRPPEGSRAMGGREWGMFGAAVALLLLFGFLLMQLFGRAN